MKSTQWVGLPVGCELPGDYTVDPLSEVDRSMEVIGAHDILLLHQGALLCWSIDPPVLFFDSLPFMDFVGIDAEFWE